MLTRLADGLEPRDVFFQSITLKIIPYQLNIACLPHFRSTLANKYTLEDKNLADSIGVVWLRLLTNHLGSVYMFATVRNTLDLQVEIWAF